MKKLLLVIILMVVIAVGYFFVSGVKIHRLEPTATPTPTSAPFSEDVHDDLGTAPDELSFDEYELVRDDLVAVVNEYDPTVAMRVLQNRMDANDKVLRSCHPLVHDIGHAAYTKYKDFGKASLYQQDICNAGYLHGVIEYYFAKIDDPATAMQTLCKGAPDLGRCYHAVGHGLMFKSENDLPQSIALCETYPTTYAKNQCAQGAYMENFNSDMKAHLSQYLKTDDPLYPCADQPVAFRPGCYYYAPVYYLALHRDDYQGMLQLCSTAGIYRSDCARGTGSRILKNNLRNLAFVEQQCDAAPADLVASCIDGVVGFYINQYNSVQKGRDLCPTLELKNQSTCRTAIEARKYQFEM